MFFNRARTVKCSSPKRRANVSTLCHSSVSIGSKRSSQLINAVVRQRYLRFPRLGGMSEIVFPVLSSSIRGPLGVAHLPRLWLKLLLHSCGRLPEGYRCGVGGLDEFLTTTLGIDRDAFVAWVE